MQTLQRLQEQQQQQVDELLHLQMSTETETEADTEIEPETETVMENERVGNCENNVEVLHNSSSYPSSPPSPLSTSSMSSSSTSSVTPNTTSPPSLGVNLRVTGQCSQGGRKYMEDYFSVAYQHSENGKDLEYAFFGIFDGHGGAEAAAFAKEHLMMEIINQKSFWSDSDEDVLRAIREGYIATHFAMWREQDKWPKTANGLPSTAGTTATVAFIRREKIYIGHVGDSGIVLGYSDEGSDYWRAKQLTVDHKPESAAEYSRISRSGGDVVYKSGVPRVVWKRPRNPNHRGPLRHNTPVDEIPFLAVARSLGDLWSYNSQYNEFVVSPDPDVQVINIDPKTFRCLIFGTDGLWNVVTPQKAVHVVYQNEFVNNVLKKQFGDNLSKENGWKNPSKNLVEIALNIWSFKKMRADNTSVVTVILHPPNGSGIDCPTVPDINNFSKLEDYTSNINSGLQYTQLNSLANRSLTYREMANKYLPPIEFRNFDYFDDSMDNKDVHMKLQQTLSKERCIIKSTHFSSTPTTIDALEFMCNDKEMERILVSNVKDAIDDVGASFKVRNTRLDDEATENLVEDDGDDAEADADDDDDDDTDEEDCEDICDDDLIDDIEDKNAINEGHMLDENTTTASNCHAVYASHFKELGATTSGGSYMSTFAESYNTLLDGDAHMSGEVSTSNSSSSYKSHCSTSMQELMQEQQRYQQQCMSEEEGYSLTKLETRREQQRCHTGVQTFRIFQQQQQHLLQQQQQEAATQTNVHENVDCESTYMWQRYTTYQQQQQQQQQESTNPQTAQSLELNSLLQQEREEEQQVELERQMELERLQQQQQPQELDEEVIKTRTTQESTTTSQNSTMATGEFILKGASSDDLPRSTKKTIENNLQKVTESDLLKPESETETGPDPNVTLNEEYLLEGLEDSSVQINEISSSSSSCVLRAKKTNSVSLVKTVSKTLISPMPTSSTSRESIYEDAYSSSSSSTSVSIKNGVVHKMEPKIIEKLENIEILHEKPELVIETTSPSTTMMSTRSRQRQKIEAVKISKRRVPTTRLLYRNVPNENQQHQHQHQHQQHPHSHQSQQRQQQTKMPPALLRFKPVLNSEVNVIFSKRQLRSTSNSNCSSNSGNIHLSCSNNNRKLCCHNTNTAGSSASSSSNSIDYAKRTLRTRNSLSKDFKPKTAVVNASLKRTTTTSNATTRFLRTHAVNILNMQQNNQIFVTPNVKKSPATAAITTTTAGGGGAAGNLMTTTRNQNQNQNQNQQRHQLQMSQQQQQQRPLSATSFNFMNLRSRQIGCGGSKINGVVGSTTNGSGVAVTCRNPLMKSTTQSQLSTTHTPRTAHSTMTPPTTTYARRNLRSLKNSASTATTIGLATYCKSMRNSQSVTALVAALPPSPKHLNSATANVTIALTRARTANVVSAQTPTSTASVLGTCNFNSNRKRSARHADLNLHATSSLSNTRAPKRLKR